MFLFAVPPIWTALGRRIPSFYVGNDPSPFPAPPPPPYLVVIIVRFVVPRYDRFRIAVKHFRESFLSPPSGNLFIIETSFRYERVRYVRVARVVLIASFTTGGERKARAPSAGRARQKRIRSWLMGTRISEVPPAVM